MNLTIESLSKTYSAKKALDGVSFSLTPGVYGLIGPNGAGKTTLMNIIAGNLHPSTGCVLYDGQDITALGNGFRNVLGYMPQQQALYPDFTAERFLYYIAALRGLDKKSATQRIDWAIEQVNLKEHIRKRIGAMSGGMKQRLLLAQAILAEPEILILDEPTAGLDPNQRIAVRNLIGKLAGDRIIIISTHVVPDVEYIANEFLILRDGKLLAHSDREGLTEPLKGKVFELEVPAQFIDIVLENYLVSNVIREGDLARLRVVVEGCPPFPAVEQRPTLDDTCLLCFGRVNHAEV